MDRRSLFFVVVSLFLTVDAVAAQHVAICHFEDHAGDFVTTGRGCGCLSLGGEVEIVDQADCADPHAASGNCGADNTGLIDLPSCGPGIPGAWFGRAVPVDPFCTPGAAGCPVPPEVIMLPTFYEDGTMLGNDSLDFGGAGRHTTASGHWRESGSHTLEATMLWLQGDPAEAFTGAVRTRYIGELQGPHLMTGFVNVWLFPFVDPATGAVNLDADEFPVPDPLTPLGPFITDPALCNPAAGCLAVLEFVVRRINTDVDD